MAGRGRLVGARASMLFLAIYLALAAWKPLLYILGGGQR
jgi:hypothetical protein